jgi:hypothetical protein
MNCAMKLRGVAGVARAELAAPVHAVHRSAPVASTSPRCCAGAPVLPAAAASARVAGRRLPPRRLNDAWRCASAAADLASTTSSDVVEEERAFAIAMARVLDDTK